MTGVCPPVHALARVMHRHGGYCFVDYAASAPYVDIDMHPADPLEKLDAVYFSPHKFLGGPGTPGVLVFDSRLYHNRVPDQPGGSGPAVSPVSRNRSMLRSARRRCSTCAT